MDGQLRRTMPHHGWRNYYEKGLEMKLATFNAGAGDHVGIVDGDEVVDLTAADPSLAP
ncbi:MAG: hypothetical protein ABSB01_23965 [Streptosporangiaceae bacterium]